MTTVAIIAPDGLLRRGLTSLISDAEPDYAVRPVATVEDLGKDVADVLVLTIANGIKVVATAIEARSEPVLVVGGALTDAELANLLERGARGVLREECAGRMLGHAVATVLSGGLFLGPGLIERLLLRAYRGQPGSGPYGLTTQERRVLSLLPDGLSNREIGNHLGISANTTKTHLGNGMRKIGASNRFEAAKIVERHGIDAL